jgi:hypothetical protein
MRRGPTRRLATALLAFPALLAGCDLLRPDTFTNFDATLGDEVTVAQVEGGPVELPGTDTCLHYIYEAGDFFCITSVSGTSFGVIKNGGSLPALRLGRLLFPESGGYLLVTDMYDNERGRPLLGLSKLKGETAGQLPVECYGIDGGVVTTVQHGRVAHYDLDLRRAVGAEGECTEFAR